MRWLITIAAIILAAFLFFILIKSGNEGMPGFAVKNSRVQEAYLFATNFSEQLDGVNCFCGCMQHLHDGRIHKRGLLDCFMKENGDYEQHASNCDMCINDALEVKKYSQQGLSKDEIKEKIYSKYI